MRLAIGSGEPVSVTLVDRYARDVGHDDSAPTWTITIDGVDATLEPARAAMLTLADGVVGARTEIVNNGNGYAFAAGIYQGDGPATSLAPLPTWNHSPFEAEITHRRVLDLRDGTLHTELETPTGAASTLAFASLERPGTTVLVAESPEFPRDRDGPLRLPLADGRGRVSATGWSAEYRRGGAAAVGSERVVRQAAARQRLERLVSYAVDPNQPPRPEAAMEALEVAEKLGVEMLLAEQRSAWSRRWAAADIVIEGDPELQRAVRFCLFHLMSSVGDRPEAALGAKGLSGPGYRGHVFWDTDVFVLPFLAATHPAAARALVGYRVARLDDARRAAQAGGFAGARFPWESADGGADVTPRQLPDKAGNLVDVLTGRQEEHITADVAWAMGRYAAWSGDRHTHAARRELLHETARYWVSRMRMDEAGVAHIDGVIGPDEYHENVNDNAFTNAMVRWNLTHAAAVKERVDDEARLWMTLSTALADGYDASGNRHEQFAGYFDLEPLAVSDLPPTSDPVDVIGWDRVQRAQLVKQADVLMLHLLVPALAPAGSLDNDIDWYEPRTTHASSLSGPVHAAVHARAGRLDQAVEYLRRSATLDLENRTGRTDEGLHIATMGGVWHALVHGIAGLELHGQNLSLHPRLPRGWDSLAFHVLLQGVGFQIRVTPDRVTVHTDARSTIRVGEGAEWIEVEADGVVLEHDSHAWRRESTGLAR